MRVSEMIKAQKECPPGLQWCPIQKKCVKPGSGGGGGTKARLRQFFKDHPNPDDKAVHQLAAQLKVSPHDLETQIYALLSELLNGEP